jgi:cobalt-zinc-cadmium resistance protein CzcA
MSKLIQFALTQRMLVTLMAVMLAGFGYYAFQQLPIDAFPDVSPTQVKTKSPRIKMLVRLF